MSVYNIPDEFYETQIQLLVGNAGSGKTFWSVNHKQNEFGIFLDLENRYKQMLKFHPDIPITPADEEDLQLGTYTNCVVYDSNFDIDKIATYEKVSDTIDKAILLDPKLIVLDGISDLRRMAKEKYEAETGKQAYGFQAWGIINNDVKRVLFRLFNYARVNDIQIVITTFFLPIYENGERTKLKEIDAKDYITANVDEVLAFIRRDTSFHFKRGKSPRGPTDLIEWTAEKVEEDEQ